MGMLRRGQISDNQQRAQDAKKTKSIAEDLRAYLIEIPVHIEEQTLSNLL